ncbi:IS5 family transposase [Streptosporangium carneum]|uniref:IS5 family transposase n=1 Tax=Streptosporangium carneum TaxID=47481 RepID=A0A9W6HZB7_9ACTN|nr:IS5 family transposase [Streptosporangium carneum]
MLARLRNGDTYARLAAGFALGTSTAWRYVREAVDLLATLADDVTAAVLRACRLADERPYYSGKHKRHGMNAQVLADPAGRPAWASPALPGATHDLTAARTTGLIDALTTAKVNTFADKGYQGAGGTIRTPFKRHRLCPPLSRHQRSASRAHARVRVRGERAVATLKTWKVLARLRCCAHHTTPIVQAILVLQLIEEGRCSG